MVLAFFYKSTNGPGASTPPAVPSTPLPTLTSEPSVTPDSEALLQSTTEPVLPATQIRAPDTTTVIETPTPDIESYTGHTVGADETLDTVARRSGSTPELIVAYNQLTSPPQP
ncbi:MAG: hypothetical protein GFH27_549297n22 [Chloroflexi bacterium AL-W]|nr:hypothetical protein [Chloroflexi bacterium AL-N1]NOK68548.1 hypothetical protein [Chloroflexi bacterium AL-N10]NOK76034.1 hypothetical protein [Chloroflexi bacterium AL-N5]NOK82505.1 hypothetical protein [Chloroflexi bacterium AL-W]NOK92817.1 hypothetical protein [Chloroflexi bacterium AL-N15]